MSVEIKVANIEPIRQTFARVARRFGEKKPASRYQEASFDLQPRDNFHYRPIWDPEHDIYDARRTAIEMADWDGFKDPRQFYYATYVINRARLQETAEKNFEFIEKHGLMATLSADQITQIELTLLPLRHLEWGANLNNCFITAYGFGSPLTQGAMYNTTDRLGMAQYLSRVGLLLDGNSGESLASAKQRWLTAPEWQPMRKLVEDTLALKDWFEIFIAQNLIQDALVHPVMYGRYQSGFSQPNNAFLAMLIEFMQTWYVENVKWVDASVKTAATESPDNAEKLSKWARHWTDRVVEALIPLVDLFDSEDGEKRLTGAIAELESRLNKLGLTV